MARTVLPSVLLSRIKERGEIRTVYISDAVIKDWADESKAELYDLMVAQNPDWFTTSATLSTVSGTPTIALPSDFYREQGVDVLDSGTWLNVPRFNFAERNCGQTGGVDRRSISYLVRDSTLRLMPTPTWSGATIRLWYIPACAKIDWTGDTAVDFVNGWDEYVVIDVLIKAAVKEESDATALMAQKAAVLARISHMAADRNAGEPPRVRDVDRERDGTWPSFYNP